jgi:hypothetical protein
MPLIEGVYNRNDERVVWVVKTYQYHSAEEVIASLTENVIALAELKAKELLGQ